MKKLLTVLLSANSLLLPLSAAHAAPTVLTNYAQVVTALKQGHLVRGVFTLDHCKLVASKSGEKQADFNGDFIGMDFSKFSNTHWTIDGKAKNGVVSTLTEVSKFENYNYRSFTYKAFEDNTAELTITIAKQPAGEIVKSSSFVCAMGQDTEQNGAVFYTVS